MKNPTLAVLSQCEAVELFVQRARAANPSFEITEATAPAVAEICVRLDGLPLAIELAAARSKLLTPQAMLERLSSRLKVLTGGARDRPARQQTMRGTIDWSYNLLDDSEKILFVRLGVFVGGWTLESAEAVCSDGLPMEVFEGLELLTDKSLIRPTEGTGSELTFHDVGNPARVCRRQAIRERRIGTSSRSSSRLFCGVGRSRRARTRWSGSGCLVRPA